MLNLTQLNIATIILDVSAIIIACGILSETRFMTPFLIFRPDRRDLYWEK